MKKTQVSLLIALIVIATLTLGACSSSKKAEDGSKTSDSKKSGKVNALTAALEESDGKKTAKIDSTITMSGSISGQDLNFTFTTTGAVSLDGKTGLLTTDLTELYNDIAGASDVSSIMEQRIINGVVYTQTPSFGGAPSTWIKQDISGLIESQNSSAQNPSQYLRYLEAISADPKKVGKETINGKETTHYSATITNEELIKKYDSEELKKYYEDLGIEDEAYENLKGAFGDEDIPVEVWIDEDGLIVRFQLEMTLSVEKLLGEAAATLGEGDLTMTIVMDYSDWGTEIEVEAPPEDEVMTQEEYLASLQDSLGQ